MIEAEYSRKWNRVTVKGHAHAGEPGKDLICAGATTLVYTLEASLEGLYKAEALIQPPKCDLQSGNAVISWVPSSRMRRSVELCVNTVMGGFAVLGEHFPDFVKVSMPG